MRANIGFLLIGLGLVGIYIALGGKFGKGSTAINPNTALGTTGTGKGVSGAQNFPNVGQRAPGGAIPPTNVPDLTGSSLAHETPKDPTTGSPVGSGGQSMQSAWTQLGHSLAFHPMDRYASRGFGR